MMQSLINALQYAETILEAFVVPETQYAVTLVL